jgi:sulfatase maturation enzyme AslB (radical SAM superfamily)
MKPIIIPNDYDYVGVYMIDKCHLACPYCITTHHGSHFFKSHSGKLEPRQWIDGFNRLKLPKDVSITLQGGEPFIYKGIWEILDNVNAKVDIMTALPPFLTKEHFLKLRTLQWNQRTAPYPTIRVSYHKGQNDYKELIERIARLQEILSIGLYYIEHPSYTKEEIEALKAYAKRFRVELRSKEFLGVYEGKQYGTYLYPDAVVGQRLGKNVLCKNTVVPIAPDGAIYLCHSDLYFFRKERALGNILDESFQFPERHLPCANYGLCSECDVKVKTNHYQQYGYTSVDIKILDEAQNQTSEALS